MKRILYNFAWIIGLLAFVAACDLFEQEEFVLGAAPTEQDAVFTYAPTEENDNIIRFTSPSSGFIKNWDFGNGTTAQGNVVTGVFPLQGSYEVTLTVYTSGGSVSSTQTIEIAETDPSLLDLPVYNMLTGGPSGPGQKTWVIDAARAGHFGVGPVDASSPIWYAAGPNEKQGGGLYNDTYTFQLEGFRYIMETAGDVYLNGAQAPNFPGATVSPVGDFTAPYTPPANLSWTVTEDAEGQQFITISNGGFIGYYTGVRTYQIISLSENEMVLKFRDAANEELAWFHRLIPEGFTPPPPPPPATVNLPIGFETQSPVFNTFGGSTYEVVDNPDKSGINTSNKVAKTEHGGETWAGLFVELTNPLDFSSQNLIRIKVWAPQTGTFRFKLENMNDPQGDFVEIDAEVTVAQQWTELEFDMSDVPSGRYARVVVFPGWGVANAGTFYFDDIRQAAAQASLTLAALTGGGAKSWRLNPAAGAFGVGPAKGSDAWWPNGGDISGDRPCLFNDEYIFKTGGEYEYKANGDVFAEGYMGVTPDGCISESALPEAAKAWGSGTHSFSFTPATATEPASITVTGTGAFIALPKAYNGGEYQAAPPVANRSVTYEVLSYTKTATRETLAIAVDISGDGSGFWNFVLIAD